MKQKLYFAVNFDDDTISENELEKLLKDAIGDSADMEEGATQEAENDTAGQDEDLPAHIQGMSPLFKKKYREEIIGKEKERKRIGEEVKEFATELDNRVKKYSHLPEEFRPTEKELLEKLVQERTINI